jgi:arylsulfatase A-like enzyme
VVEEGYSTTLLGNDAVKVVERHDPSTPLFLYFAFNAAHTPYQAPPDYLDRYKQIDDPSRRAYAGSITAMDDQIGRVLAALEKKKMRENTLILFASDNGGTRNALFAGAVADVSKVKIPCDNGPFREGKGTNYEGGTRVVALANWPGRIGAATKVAGMIHMVDVYPTLLRLAGGKLGESKALDGVDVWPTIAEGKASPRTELVYNVEPFRSAVRRGDWKLVWRHTLPTSIELFNVAEDPSEKSNVASRHPDVVAELQQRANALAGEAAKPMLLEAGFGALLQLFHLPAAFPGEAWYLAQEH